MRTHPRRSASVVASAAALLLLLTGAPAGATAGAGDDRQPAPAPEAEERADGHARFQASDEHDAGTQQESRPSAAEDRGQREAAGSGRPASTDARPVQSAETGRGGNPSSDGASASNRGSVKVKAVGSDSFPPSNEPHLPCTFEIHLYGFAAGTADVRIDVHAPTGEGRVYTAEVALSDARGNQVSAVHGPVDLGEQLVGSFEPHPQQGYHLKLYVDRRESTGGAKQKVFWVECDDEADVGGAAVETTVGGAAVETTVGDSGGVAPAEAETGGAATAVTGEVLSSGATAAQGAAAGAEQAGAEGPAGMLPRTGAALLTLALVGAAAIAAGTALLRARRGTLGS